MSRDKVHVDRGRNTGTADGDIEAELEIEQCEQLLPGIPDEITICLISPKLPWPAFHTLSSVSHGWQRAIQSRQVYDARVRKKSTQTLAAMFPSASAFYVGIKMLLYSMEDVSSYSLPPIPDVEGGFPTSCQCTSLDGKLYLLGGIRKGTSLACAEVYMLDVASQGHWKRCTRMTDPRSDFGCGVKDGKIYVFGGKSGSHPVCTSEVYDPKEDAWSPIMAMPSVGYGHDVSTVGEKLFVYNGSCYGGGHKFDRHVCFAEVYDPLKNDWDTVQDFTEHYCRNVVLTVGGKLHRLNRMGIQIYDIRANSWGPLQPFSFDVPARSRFFIVFVVSAVDVGGEVLAIVESKIRHEDDETWHDGPGLIRSQGLNGKKTGLVWHTLNTVISVSDYLDYPNAARPLQL